MKITEIPKIVMQIVTFGVIFFLLAYYAYLRSIYFRFIPFNITSSPDRPQNSMQHTHFLNFNVIILIASGPGVA
jgi:hypothetical protein